MADHTLGTIRGTIEIDYDGAGIVRGIKEVNQFKDSSNNAANTVLRSFGKFAKGAAIVGGSISTLNSTAGLLVGILSVLGPLAAAGFAAAPALILGYASAMAVAKIATAGVGDALAEAGGDAKKFEEAVKKLSPEAQKFARAYKESLPVLQNVQKAMQDAFFKGTAGQVGGVVKAVASLKPEARAVAANMGDLVQNVVKTATSSKNIASLRAVLQGVNDFLAQIKGSIGPVVTGFLGLAAQGAAFGGQVGTALSDALANLSRWLSQIDVAEIFANAAPIVQSLGSFLGDVATIAQELFGIFIGDGGNAAGVLATLASNLADFLQSAQGQAALEALQTAMATIGGAVGQVFLALLQALAPVIVALAPGAGQLATQIASILVPALQAASPLLQAIAQYLSQNMSWLGPLAGAVVAAAAGYKVYAAAANAVGIAQDLLKSKLAQTVAEWVKVNAAMVIARARMIATAAGMAIVRVATVAWTVATRALGVAMRFATGPIGIIIAIVAALAAGIMYLWNNNEGFRNAVIAIWNGIKAAISAVGNWITGTLWPNLVRAWNAIRSGAQSLWNGMVAIWNGIKNTIETNLNAVRAIVRAVWNYVSSDIRAKIALIRAVIQAGFNAARNIVNSVMNTIRGVIRTVWNGIVSVVRSAINNVKNAINAVGAIVGIVRGHFNRAKSAIQNVLSSAIGVVRGFPGRVRSALGNLGSILYNSGKALIQGFINGIKAMIGAAAGAARSVVNAVSDFLPGSPAKKGPLSGKGYVLLRAQRFMTDFAKGVIAKRAAPIEAIRSTVGAVGNATTPAVKSRTVSSALTAQVARIASGLANTTPTFTGGGSGGAGGTRTYNISIGDKRFATLVVDVITGNPVTVAKSANEGNRRSSWAGNGRLTSAVKSQTIKSARRPL